MGTENFTEDLDSFYEKTENLLNSIYHSDHPLEKEKQMKEIELLSKRFQLVKEAYLKSYHLLQRVEKKMKKVRGGWKSK